MSAEYTAPQVRVHMRDMLGDAARLLAPEAPVKAKISQVALAMRMPFARVRRYWYDLVDRVPADEYLTVQGRLAQIRQRLGALENQYNQARKEILADDPSLAGVLPPEIGASDHRAVKRRAGGR